MARDVRDTLMLPFGREDIVAPTGGERWCFLNAQPLPVDATIRRDKLVCEQGFRPDFNRLSSAGYFVEPQLEGVDSYPGALLLLGRNRRLNEYNLTLAWNSIHDGGTVVCAGEKTAGIQSLKKWVAERADISGSLSKHHAQVFWLQKTGQDLPLPDIADDVGGYRIEAGMFSADGPDKASRFLVDHFNERIRGCVADFGTGWGYLSGELLKRTDSVVSLALYEADYRSLEAARHNLAAYDEPPISFYWQDIPGEFDDAQFNWVIMNPPFHTGRAADPELGSAFVRTAHRALMPGGRLLMVANTHLPYERDLKHCFRSVKQIAQQDGFKILEAVR
ncbi:MAG: class I SAM-dependent methyltransferase [Rhizobiaceae bacterium]